MNQEIFCQYARMDIVLSRAWNFVDFADEAFTTKAVEWVEGGTARSSKVVQAVQEFGPGVVAVRDDVRGFFLVVDPLRWVLDGKVSEAPMLCVEQSALGVSRESFDDLFVGANRMLSARVPELELIHRRPSPTVATPA
ncbi:hypothetical protein BH11PAT4_BH11PAT4_2260 [soil metagenome]